MTQMMNSAKLGPKEIETQSTDLFAAPPTPCLKDALGEVLLMTGSVLAAKVTHAVTAVLNW
jgi:hypothetical protein